MVKSCCVKDCTSHIKKHPDRKFFIFPSSGARREKLKAAVNRGIQKPDGSVNPAKLWSPRSKHTYVCSAHFITGRKVNVQPHPDYVPSIFPQRPESVEVAAKKSSLKVARYERAARRANKPAVTPNARRKLSMPERSTASPTHNLASQQPSEDDTHVNDSLIECHEDESEMSLSAVDISSMEASMSTEGLTKPLHISEREMFITEIENLRRDRDDALSHVSRLQQMLNCSSLSVESVKDNNDLCHNLTGISWDVFVSLFEYLSETSACSTNKSSIPLKEQFFLTLVKLRQNITFDCLSHVKAIPKSTLIGYFWKWIDILYAKIGFMVHWPDREAMFEAVPLVFKEKFPRLTTIIDCFEIFIEAPKNLKARAQCYSNYKKHCTIKFLIACTPLGAISFISKAWGGRASDVQIVRESGFISPTYHFPGDQILADRGFTLADDFATLCSAELLTPAFTRGKTQLSAKEVEVSRKISSVRIHVERVIGLMKNRFGILKGTLPVRCIKSCKDESMDCPLSSCDKILTVCASLTNLGPGIVFRQ